MEYLFLVIGLIIFLVLETVLDNILWIGGIILAYLLFSIVRQFVRLFRGEDDFGLFIFFLIIKLGIGAFIIYLMCA